MTAPTGYGQHGHRWSVRFRYNAALVELVKSVVGWRDRSWSPDDRCWYVDQWAIDELADALRASGCAVRRLNADGTVYRDSACPSWAEALLSAVGPQRREAAFRALARVLHPDVDTGDHELMRELIAARELVT